MSTNKFITRKRLWWMGWLMILILSRTLFLGQTARFTRDESSDLSRMHEYWVAKKITLVGPISNNNVKVFSSLTYYMLMPFAVFGKFSATSPVWGSAVYGILTGGLLVMILSKKISGKQLLVAALLITIMYPFIESSRWAWNPNLMPFWFAIAVFCLQIPTLWSTGIAGFAFGLATHNHYVAIIPSGLFILIKLVTWFKDNKYRYMIMMCSGFLLALCPFILFDLRHPPGLFLGSYLDGTPDVAKSISVPIMLSKLGLAAYTTVYTLIRHQILAIMLGLVSICLVIVDIREKNKHIWQWILPILGMIIASIFLDTPHTRYFLAVIVFFVMWVMEQRTSKWGVIIQKILWIILIIGSVVVLKKAYSPEVLPATGMVDKIALAIEQVIKDYPDIKNPNITTDMSEDGDMLSEKYRDLLSVKGISFRAASEYDASENLFVITQEEEETKLRSSVSFPLQKFNRAKTRQVITIKDSNWKIYWLSYE